MTAVAARPSSWFYAGNYALGVTHTDVRVKSRWALSPRGLRHRVVAATAAWLDGQVAYRGVWLCGDSSTCITFLPGDVPAGRTCERCALRDAFPARPVVYRFFDANDRLLYIGSTGDLGQRAYAHRCRSTWWPKQVRVEIQDFSSLNAARAAEAEAIAAERPAHNVHHMPVAVSV